MEKQLTTTDNKINFKAAEKEIGKKLSKIYRSIVGRGPINTEARIVNQAIFIQYKVERISMERKYIEFLHLKNQEHEFFDFIRPDFITVINTFMKELNPYLSVDGMEFRVDETITYMLVTLNKNLEKMLLSGEAKLSHYED